MVLDFFAGSGTTGHAVALAERGGRRHAALRRASTPPSRPAPGPTPAPPACVTVADITRARLRAVADVCGGGFEEFTLDS